VAVLFIDLDGFEHQRHVRPHCGDQLPRRSSGWRRHLRDSDSIGRLGGDEFVVLVEGAGLDGVRARL
jgi:GGDEF domain-containing protein